MKKVLIMTLKQGTNYGGILQAYALQRVVKSLGGDPVTSASTHAVSLKQKIIIFTNVGKLRRLLQKKSDPRVVAKKNTSMFIDEHIKLVDFKSATRLDVGLYVSGSDQVWRRPYTYIPHSFFSFAKNDVSRISYAASFGKDNLEEYSDRLIAKTKKLARTFDAVSVREDTGVEIAQKHWGVSAEHHIDPTLLLESADYSSLIDRPTSPTYAPDGELFSYVLDKAEDKQAAVGEVARVLSLRPFQVIDGSENSSEPMPPVEQWLRSFRDAKFVVTDSFHGTVFAIIFNKPFIAIGNKNRGLARFQSLLQIFNLEDRLVESVDEVTKELIKRPIEWNEVNRKIKEEQERSLKYLKSHLK